MVVVVVCRGGRGWMMVADTWKVAVCVVLNVVCKISTIL